MFGRRPSHLPKVPHPLRACPKHPPSRSFHSTSPRQLTAELIQVSHSAFEFTHSYTGLSWTASIFITGAVWRFAWLPMNIYISSQAKKRQKLGPIQQAWRRHLAGMSRIHFPDTSQFSILGRSKWLKDQLARTKTITRTTQPLSVLRSIGLQALFMPIWLLNADVLRRMAGSEFSLLGAIGLTSTVDILSPEPGFTTEKIFNIVALTDHDPSGALALAVGVLQLLSVYNRRQQKETSRRLHTLWLEPPTIEKNRERFLLLVTQSIPMLPLVICLIWMVSNISTAVLTFMCGSAAAQLATTKLSRFLVGLKDPQSSGGPKIARLKSKYRDRAQQLDDWIEPAGNSSDGSAMPLPSTIAMMKPKSAAPSAPRSLQPKQIPSGAPRPSKRE